MPNQFFSKSSAVVRTFLAVEGTEVQEEQLKRCATLFSEHYGVWASNVPPPLKAGSRVRLNPARLRKQCLTDPEHSILGMSYFGDTLIGHVFAAKWKYGQECVAWVTQLVVHADHRRKYIATALLQQLKTHPWFDEVTVVGVASSHPAACHAVCKLFHQTPGNVDLAFIARHAPAILECSPVDYLRPAKPKGSIFSTDDSHNDANGAISSVDTAYFIDHREPLDIVEHYVAGKKWKLGKLLDGHEFLVVISVPDAEKK